MAPVVVLVAEKKLVASSIRSFSRTSEDRARVGEATETRPIRAHAERLVKPKSVSGAMRKTGIALLAAPEPFSAVPGVALVAASFAVKKNEAIGLSHLAEETRRLLGDLRSLSV